MDIKKIIKYLFAVKNTKIVDVEKSINMKETVLSRKIRAETLTFLDLQNIANAIGCYVRLSITKSDKNLSFKDSKSDFINIAEFVEAALQSENVTHAEISRRTKQSAQNFYKKFMRGKFRIDETERIAEALGASLIVHFVDKATDEIIV